MKPQLLPAVSALILFCEASLCLGQDSAKIKLSPAMVVNESARGDAGQLVDEQELAGDPLGGKGGQPANTWNIGYHGQDLYYPLTATIDLGAEHQLSEIFIYDSNNTGEFCVESGTPVQWRPLLIDKLLSYKQWNRHIVDVKTRYLHVTMAGPSTYAPEIVVYGRALQPIQIQTVLPAKPRAFALMGDLIGTNAFIDDTLERMQAVGFVREYHSWAWDAGDNKSNDAFPNNRAAFNPSSAAGGNAWFFDDYYAKLKKAGITVAPSIKASVNWLFPTGTTPTHRVADAGQDPTLPSSYKAHSDHLFQFAARYGSRKVDDVKLKLMPNQPRLSGLGLLQYFENDNEPDAWWGGRGSYSTPFELAARCSADYDGHRKSMGDTFGVKNADPNAKLVLGGLANPSLDYIKAIKWWADWHRDGDFPVDVLNVHHYSNDVGGQGQSKVGISPEADGLKQKLEKLAEYRNRYLSNKELWLTEFGYDTNPGSVQRAPALGTTSSEETQARWIIRSYLACAAAGIDRAAQYMLRDVDRNDGEKYNSSGLVTEKGKWEPKRSWFYTYTLKNRLGKMRFAGEVDSGNPQVWIYKFQSEDGKGAYVVWCPTAENREVKGYSLKNLAVKTATLVQFMGGEIDGKATPLEVKSGEVSIDVSESPVMVQVDSLL